MRWSISQLLVAVTEYQNPAREQGDLTLVQNPLAHARGSDGGALHPDVACFNSARCAPQESNRESYKFSQKSSIWSDHASSIEWSVAKVASVGKRSEVSVATPASRNSTCRSLSLSKEWFSLRIEPSR